jgi:hypothetical protein
MFRNNDGDAARPQRAPRDDRARREMEAFRALRRAAELERDEMLDVVAAAMLREFEVMDREARNREAAPEVTPTVSVVPSHGLRLVQ